MKVVRETPASDSPQEWLARERAHFAQVLYRYTPLVVEHAKGSYLYTVDGRRYLDFACGIAVTNLGHGHPWVLRAAHEQLDKLVHLSVVGHHEPNIVLAERIAAVAPGKLDKVFFANSGAEAVEGAVKLARYVTRRPAIIAFADGVEELLPRTLRTVPSQHLSRPLSLRLPQPIRARRRGHLEICLRFHR